MEALKKERKVKRSAFTKSVKNLEELLAVEEKEWHSIEVTWELIKEYYTAVQVSEEKVYVALQEADADEKVLEEELDVKGEYYKTSTSARLRIEDLERQLRGGMQPVACGTTVVSEVSQSRYQLPDSQGNRKFNLPVIEFKQFDGDVRHWLSFWAQFKKIHEDLDIDLNDKISYLIQATLPGSRARQVVESFPAMQENYAKIIDSLKSRFGREDLQIEVYVRELLKLILDNAISPGKIDISTLYDKIECQLRALETLGVTKNKCAAMLFPLIESSLPEQLLRAWQRSPEYTGGRGKSNNDDPNQSPLEKRLESLLCFLKREVEGEQRILLASESFGLRSVVSNGGNKNPDRNRQRHMQKTFEQKVPTAAGLVNCNVVACIFCQGSHESALCFKAQAFTFDRKKELIMKKKGCFRCLAMGHQAKRCRARLQCVICAKSHVTLMCPELPAHKQNSCKSNEKREPEQTGTEFGEPALANYSCSHVFLQTLRVQVNGGISVREVRALIDTGSQRSYILASTALDLVCTSKGKERIIHSLFGGAETMQNHNCYYINVSKDDYYCNVKVLDQPSICNAVSHIFYGPWINELEEVGIRLSDTSGSDPIELLIGADFAGKLYTGRRHILKNGLVAVETTLGWTLMGQVPTSKPDTSTTMTVLSLFVKDASIANLWELDLLGIAEPTTKRSCQEMADVAKELFLQTIEVNGEGRYEVRLPWLEGHPPLPDNYSVSKNRLRTTIKKVTDMKRLEAYDGVFREWLEEGIIEEIKLDQSKDKCHYLPHRPVVKEHSSTKIRPVFDASAREKDRPSLNHCLEKGVNLIELIPTILLRFRDQKIGVVSDIRKAFLQISLHEADRDFLRFLWVNADGDETIYRHKRVVFGVNCSPFLLGATIEYHLSQGLKRCETEDVDCSVETISQLQKSFYVDNCVTSVPSEVVLKRFIRESNAIMNQGCFDLRGWEFTDISKKNGESSVFVLGLNWNTQRDTLSLVESNIENVESFKECVTKRVILTTAQRIFDPIGFTCPTTLIPKLLLQRIWQQQLSWDMPVDEEIKSSFLKWLRQVRCLLSIEIPRWIRNETGIWQDSSLYLFCDASKNAYAAVVFLRVCHQGEVHVNLLLAKARVALLRGMTIPRLELLAVTIGARLYASVKESLNFEGKSFFWSDSSTVLCWIGGSEEWAPFVDNRVKEIRSLTDCNSWRHVPGELNPADLPSRGCSGLQLLESRW
ncbi:hypothetical protein ILUMI_05397 [Ignelater luminosus]|uniref:Peptidase aspartic putative domain-containing protein n=1 Tax=Ignelater luminosus TaxID=2038154 RepID=A0A8K0DC11_IGNLU|nr:hypothetical protein ILUMI_05397 [Ignelater luminosus]